MNSEERPSNETTITPAPPYLPQTSHSNHQTNENQSGRPSSRHPSVYQSINDPLSRDFPEIAEMSKEDLQDLLQDEDYFRAVFIGLPQVKELMENQQELIAANEAIAHKNLSLKDRLEQVREETAKAFNHTHSLITTFGELSKEQAELYQPFGEQAIRSRLLTALHESDRLTESLASEFAEEGSMEEDLFVKQYRESRTIFHRRALIAERWSEGKIRWD
ncbi:hypothetical protein CROQUDRAFT_90957 [Cronartium quercuum f. sp. fusiforme G11]|uniref:VPS37 C-terminal domain-containing protein n=1 Tax=Cronartium quercuum f. sp. fusiforme G11 TaxID=708437 RepID=A0A9P6NKT3_9BASI|nr:hypothetical protein CROQUDRAFT_90957 [Cronartium quercuum f. sp. fusiforme G11]